MSSAASVRMAGSDDAAKITTLINGAFRRAEEFFIDTDRVNLEVVRNYLVSGKFLLAEIEDSVVGCVYVELRSSDNARAYLGLLAVDPARQNFGLGTLLMNAAETYCRELGCRFIELYVVNLRKELAGFYENRGYVVTGTSAFPADVKTKLPCHFLEMSKPL